MMNKNALLICFFALEKGISVDTKIYTPPLSHARRLPINATKAVTSARYSRYTTPMADLLEIGAQTVSGELKPRRILD